MPKGIDPKAYAARITKAKKIVEAMDPATRQKIKDMYPSVKKEQIVDKALNPKKAVAKKAAPASMVKKAVAKKVAAKPTAKPATKAPVKKAPAKKKVEVMPDKINPFKMTPAQKARYLKNPERYDY
jgi:hypothetical protein